MPIEWTTLYSAKDLGTLGGPGVQQPRAVNEVGTVTGMAFSALGLHAFRYKDSQLQDLTPGLSAVSGAARGLNNLSPEQIVGDIGNHAALWTDAAHVDLSPILDSAYSVAVDINDDGLIAGSAGDAALSQRAFRLDLQSQQHETLLFPGHNHSTTAAINSYGAVVGVSMKVSGFNSADVKVFLYDGTMHEIPPPQSSLKLNPSDVNDEGTVVGAMSYPPAYPLPPSAFVYNGTSVEPIFPPPYPTNASVAHGINNHGVIVGYNNSSLGNNAWIRSPNGTISDLNDLMFGGRSGWHLRSAWAINDNGQIVGEGTLNGVPRMFLLDPVRLPGELVAEVAIDPLALLISDTVYAQLKLPDPPPFDLVRDRVRQFLGSLQSDQKRSIQERVRAYRQFLQALERDLTDG